MCMKSLGGRRAQTKSKPARRAGVLDGRTCRAFSSALASPQSRRTVEPASLSVKRPSVATSATAPGDPVSKSANPSKSAAGARLEVASDFLEDFAGNNFDYCGPDEYRLLSANWRDRSKADAFVAKGVRRDMFMNGQEASADRFLAW